MWVCVSAMRRFYFSICAIEWSRWEWWDAFSGRAFWLSWIGLLGGHRKRRESSRQPPPQSSELASFIQSILLPPLRPLSSTASASAQNRSPLKKQGKRISPPLRFHYARPPQLASASTRIQHKRINEMTSLILARSFYSLSLFSTKHSFFYWNHSFVY